MATMDRSRIVSKIDGDFSEKLQKISHPLYFAPPLEGYRRWGQKIRVMGLPGRQRSLTIPSAV